MKALVPQFTTPEYDAATKLEFMNGFPFAYVEIQQGPRYVYVHALCVDGAIRRAAELLSQPDTHVSMVGSFGGSNKLTEAASLEFLTMLSSL